MFVIINYMISYKSKLKSIKLKIIMLKINTLIIINIPYYMFYILYKDYFQNSVQK